MKASAEKIERVRASATTVLLQKSLGCMSRLLLFPPYHRRTLGLDELERRNYLLVSNHVSLLDTMLIGAILWSDGRMPVLVLGDHGVWRKGWLRRFLSARIGFLIDRERLLKDMIRQLRCFGRSIEDFQLLVFPEGTRGDGVHVKECQAGVYFVAQEARAPIVPIFIEGMQHVSSKTTPFRPLGGLRKITVRFGQRWEPAEYQELDAHEFRAEIRRRIQELGPRT